MTLHSSTRLAKVNGGFVKVVTRAETSGPDIVCYGDSLTADGHLVAGLAALSGRTVRNYGVGGETSSCVAARQGGVPMVFAPVGGVIPASGGVLVSYPVSSASGNGVNVLVQGTGNPGGYMHGSYCGVPGILSVYQPFPNGGNPVIASDQYTFTRDSHDTPVSVAGLQPFIPDTAAARTDDIHVFWVGQNIYPHQSFTWFPDWNRSRSDVQAMVAALGPAAPRYLVISSIFSEGRGTAQYTAGKNLNAALAADHGDNFVDLRSYLISNGLSTLGITPTSQDVTDLANDTVPSSLRLPDGSVHLLGTTQDNVTVPLVYGRMHSLGWL